MHDPQTAGKDVRDDENIAVSVHLQGPQVVEDVGISQALKMTFHPLIHATTAVAETEEQTVAEKPVIMQAV